MENELAKRVVNVYSTGKNARRMSLTSNAETWEALQKDLKDAGVDIEGMSVLERKTKVDLATLSGTSSISEEALTLYLTPTEVMAGFITV